MKTTLRRRLRAVSINQDPAAFTPKVVFRSPSHQIWVRPLHGGDVAVALLNTGTTTTDRSVELSAVVCATCARQATVVDVWGGDELGSWGPVSHIDEPMCLPETSGASSPLHGLVVPFAAWYHWVWPSLTRGASD